MVPLFSHGRKADRGNTDELFFVQKNLNISIYSLQIKQLPINFDNTIQADRHITITCHVFMDAATIVWQKSKEETLEKKLEKKDVLQK